ncbi:adenylate kinase [Pavlovales sp. CCMP2436]|nr:adenylate kinase [Pavlovales sp. CCMP2436]
MQSVRPRGASHIAAAGTQGAGGALGSEVIFVLGGPGAGKGTQCALLQEAYGLVHLSAGDLLRAEAVQDTPLGGTISHILAEGQIVPSSVTVELLKQAMCSQRGPFLIDGFPRSMENLLAYEAQGGNCAFILYLDLSEEEMCERLLERGLTSGRSDDNLQTIQKRFCTFREQTMPVLESMKERGLLRHVPGTGTAEEVFARVKPLFAEIVQHA